MEKKIEATVKAGRRQCCLMGIHMLRQTGIWEFPNEGAIEKARRLFGGQPFLEILQGLASPEPKKCRPLTSIQIQVPSYKHS